MEKIYSDATKLCKKNISIFTIWHLAAVCEDRHEV